MRENAFRLRQNDDLKEKIAGFCREETGVVLSADGSLKKICLRRAGAKTYLEKEGPF